MVEDDVEKDAGQVHSLSHSPVLREDKETIKIHAVFDVSCGNNGPYLDACLMMNSGTDMPSKILDVFMGFRFNKVPVLADIRQSFVNVDVSKNHRDFLRFLWFEMNCEGQHIVIY